MNATMIELFKLITEGKWELISEFKYRRPDLRKWVDELEYQYWSSKNKLILNESNNKSR